MLPAADLLQAAIAADPSLPDGQEGPCGTAAVDTTLSAMSRLIRDHQLVDARGRKYLTADECQRFLEAARLAPRPADQAFALALAHTGARVSEALAARPMDIDREAASIRIRTLKRRAEHWREVPAWWTLGEELACASRKRTRRVLPIHAARLVESGRQLILKMRQAGTEELQAALETLDERSTAPGLAGRPSLLPDPPETPRSGRVVPG